jgi:hypothetical protein
METIEQIRHLSPSELAALGMQHLAYVKQVTVEGNEGYGIFAADGTQMGLVGDRDLAFAVVRQNELQPVSVP